MFHALAAGMPIPSTQKRELWYNERTILQLRFLPRKRSERLGKTDSAANNVSGGVCEAYVAAM